MISPVVDVAQLQRVLGCWRATNEVSGGQVLMRLFWMSGLSKSAIKPC